MSNLPPGVRVDGWVETGTEVSAYYDPLLAKIIARGATREAAIVNLTRRSARLASMASRPTCPTWSRYSPIRSSPRANRPPHCSPATHSALPGIEVLSPGTLTTVQDWPGRLGLWDVGVPPSGPMDPLAHRTGQSHGRQSAGSRGAGDDGHGRHAALRLRRGDRARRRAAGCETRRTARGVLGTDCGAARQRAHARRDPRTPVNAPALRCAADSMFPSTSAAAPPSRSDSSVDTAAAHCARVTCYG